MVKTTEGPDVRLKEGLIDGIIDQGRFPRQDQSVRYGYPERIQVSQTGAAKRTDACGHLHSAHLTRKTHGSAIRVWRAKGISKTSGRVVV